MSFPDKFHRDLQHLLNKKDFKSEKELSEFMNSLLGKPLPEISREELSDKELAEELVFEAQDLPIPEGRKKAEQALDIDKDCIAAWEYLGDIEHTYQRRLTTYMCGIKVGKIIFGGEYLKEHKGHFWGFYETRPFMRCLMKSAELLYLMGEKKSAIDTYEEIIKLNKMDNLGARDYLMLFLIELGDFEKFKKYDMMFKNDTGAFADFNRALFSFKTSGENEKSNKLLKKAMKENPYVVPIFIKPYQKFIPLSSYILGSEEEAVHYAEFAYPIWWKTYGAIAWLRKNK